MVVDNNLDDRNVVSGKRCQFIHVHTETAVACDVDDGLVRASHFRAHGRSKAEAHRSKAAGGQKRSRARIAVILRRPHLMLSDIGRDDSLSIGCLVDLLNDERSGQAVLMLQREFFLHRLDLGNPLVMVHRLQLRIQPF